MTGPRTCQSLCRNLLPAGKDELIKVPLGATTKGSGIPAPILTLAVFRPPTPAPTSALPRSIYTNMDLQQATKLALDLFV